MIERMTKYSFILLSKDTESFISGLQDLGVLDITRSAKPVDETSAGLLLRANSLKDDIAAIEKEDFTKDARHEEIAAALQSSLKEMKERQPWGEFDDDALSRLSEQGIQTDFFKCPKKKFDPVWKDKYALEVISEDGKNTYFVILHPKEETLDFPVKACEAPSASWKEAESRSKTLSSDLEEREEELRARKSELPELKAQYAGLLTELDSYLAKSTAEKCSDNLLDTFVGFTPDGNCTELDKALEGMDVFYLKDKATAEDNPPIKLRNNWFTSQFEGLTGMYGMPLYDEFDPTPVLAPFFLLFFSMCMGDAGYGILLLATAFILKRMKGGLASLWKLVMFLGIGTFLIGIVLGTFFGVSLAEVSWTPQWMKDCIIDGEIAGFNAQMVLSLAIGMFHICLAMLIKGIIYTKRFGLKETISTWGWIVLIDGALTIAALSIAGVLTGPVLKASIITVAAISFLAIFIFNRPGHNPLANIGAGLWDTYGMVTGLAGDLLSYIRLFALGLAGGMLGSAFNTLASMTLGSDPTWQWLPFIIILIIGHTLNFAMACLGAFVHPLRLNFLEFFKNCGYEGKGTAFNPISKNN